VAAQPPGEGGHARPRSRILQPAVHFPFSSSTVLASCRPRFLASLLIFPGLLIGLPGGRDDRWGRLSGTAAGPIRHARPAPRCGHGTPALPWGYLKLVNTLPFGLDNESIAKCREKRAFSHIRNLANCDSASAVNKTPRKDWPERKLMRRDSQLTSHANAQSYAIRHNGDAATLCGIVVVTRCHLGPFLRNTGCRRTMLISRSRTGLQQIPRILRSGESSDRSAVVPSPANCTRKPREGDHSRLLHSGPTQLAAPALVEPRRYHPVE